MLEPLLLALTEANFGWSSDSELPLQGVHPRESGVSRLRSLVLGPKPFALPIKEPILGAMGDGSLAQRKALQPEGNALQMRGKSQQKVPRVHNARQGNTLLRSLMRKPLTPRNASFAACTFLKVCRLRELTKSALLFHLPL